MNFEEMSENPSFTLYFRLGSLSKCALNQPMVMSHRAEYWFPHLTPSCFRPLYKHVEVRTNPQFWHEAKSQEPKNRGINRKNIFCFENFLSEAAK